MEGTPVVYLSQSLVMDLFMLLIRAVRVANLWITASSCTSGFTSGLSLIIRIRSSKVRGRTRGGLASGCMAWGVCRVFGLRSSGGVGVEDRESEGFSSSCVEVEEVSSRFSPFVGLMVPFPCLVALFLAHMELKICSGLAFDDVPGSRLSL